jgi:hypothetical protein
MWLASKLVEVLPFTLGQTVWCRTERALFERALLKKGVKVYEWDQFSLPQVDWTISWSSPEELEQDVLSQLHIAENVAILVRFGDITTVKAVPHREHFRHVWIFSPMDDSLGGCFWFQRSVPVGALTTDAIMEMTRGEGE